MKTLLLIGCIAAALALLIHRQNALYGKLQKQFKRLEDIFLTGQQDRYNEPSASELRKQLEDRQAECERQKDIAETYRLEMVKMHRAYDALLASVSNLKKTEPKEEQNQEASEEPGSDQPERPRTVEEEAEAYQRFKAMRNRTE